MGYTNRDKRLVNVTRDEKRAVRKMRRLAEKRELNDEHTRSTHRATRRGWWFA